MTAMITPQEKVPIADIVVGDRVRKDYGDLDGLMRSITEHGLLQPVGLAPGDVLLFGGRRLEALRRLGWTEVPVTRPITRTDALSLLKAERDENTCRKAMTPEELVDLGLRIEELEKPEADRRKLEGRRRGGRVGGRGIAPPSGEGKASRGHGGETAAVVGEALGLSRSQYSRAKTIVQIARGDRPAPAPTRALAQTVLADINAENRTVNGGYEVVRRALRQPEQIEPPAVTVLPFGPTGRLKGRSGSRRTHLQILQIITIEKLPALARAAEEIKNAGLDSSVTAGEAARLMGDLSKQIRSLGQIKRLLEERSSC